MGMAGLFFVRSAVIPPGSYFGGDKYQHSAGRGDNADLRGREAMMTPPQTIAMKPEQHVHLPDLAGPLDGLDKLARASAGGACGGGVAEMRGIRSPGRQSGP